MKSSTKEDSLIVLLTSPEPSIHPSTISTITSASTDQRSFAMDQEDHQGIIPPPPSPLLKASNKKPLHFDSPSSNPNYIFKSLLAGGLAGCVAKTVIGPFDRVKILFQVRSPAVTSYSGKMTGVFKAIVYVFKHDGFYGLYRGHSAMLLRIFPYAGTNFMAYEQYKRILMPTKDQQTISRRFLAGSLAGATSVFVTYPFDIMRARLAYHLSSHRELYHLMEQTHNTDIKISSLNKNSNVSEPVGFVRRFLFGSYGKPLSVSGWWPTLKILLSDPIIPSSVSLNQTPHITYRNLYKGFTPSLLGIIPYAGVSFFTFETLKNIAFKFQTKHHSHRKYPTEISDSTEALANTSPIDIPVGIKLLCGLIAGALGQTFAYPLDVVRRRMQLANVAPHLPKQTSILSVLRHIIKTEGVRGIFVGLSINYLKVAPSTAISFVTYEFLKKQFHIR